MGECSLLPTYVYWQQQNASDEHKIEQDYFIESIIDVLQWTCVYMLWYTHDACNPNVLNPFSLCALITKQSVCSIASYLLPEAFHICGYKASAICKSDSLPLVGGKCTDHS